MEQVKAETLARASKYLAEEGPLHIPLERRPWRASDIKAQCPRQVYYSRYARKASDGRVSAPAIFGTAVHSMLQAGAHDDEELWDVLFAAALRREGIDKITDSRIQWKAEAKPFALAGFLKADPATKVRALFQRYRELDRMNYLAFWKMYPFAIYRHPPTGRLGQEQRLTGTIDGEQIRTTADLVLTDVYTGEIVVVDWKTGRASEMTQLATYAMMAEQHFDLPENSIKRGFFVITGAGECHAPRGKLPTGYSADPENAVVKDDLGPWRETVRERVRKLRHREDNGIWTPVFNPLCYRTCEYRSVCPVGRSLQEVRAKGEK